MSELKTCSTMLEEKQKLSQKQPCLRIFRVVQMSKFQQFSAVQLIFVIYFFILAVKALWSKPLKTPT